MSQKQWNANDVIHREWLQNIALEHGKEFADNIGIGDNKIDTMQETVSRHIDDLLSEYDAAESTDDFCIIYALDFALGFFFHKKDE